MAKGVGPAGTGVAAVAKGLVADAGTPVAKREREREKAVFSDPKINVHTKNIIVFCNYYYLAGLVALSFVDAVAFVDVGSIAVASPNIVAVAGVAFAGMLNKRFMKSIKEI